MSRPLSPEIDPADITRHREIVFSAALHIGRGFRQKSKARTLQFAGFAAFFRCFGGGNEREIYGA